jgi:hypothetical protein
MSDQNSFDKWLLNDYEKSVLRAIIQFDPTGIGPALEIYLSQNLAKIKEKNFRILMEQLSTGEKYLTPEIIDSEEFIFAFFAVTDAALRSHREEKIKAFANLLLYGAKTGQYNSEVIYEFINILDEISIREFRILNFLHEFEEITSRNEDENDLQFSTRLWNDFEIKIHSELNISPEELRNLLTRLNRTGLYETFSGTFLSYSGGKGKTTFLYGEFIKWVQNKDEDHPS